MLSLTHSLTHPDSDGEVGGRDVGKNENQEVLVFIGRLPQHIKGLDSNVCIIIRQDERAVLVVNGSDLTEFICC